MHGKYLSIRESGITPWGPWISCREWSNFAVKLGGFGTRCHDVHCQKYVWSNIELPQRLKGRRKEHIFKLIDLGSILVLRDVIGLLRPNQWTTSVIVVGLIHTFSIATSAKLVKDYKECMCSKILGFPRFCVSSSHIYIYMCKVHIYIYY